MRPLEGIKVLDLSRVLAGPWCTQLLADLGAEVTKIERPGAGDDTRHWGPPWHGEGERRVAAYFLSCNRGKKSAAIDFSKPEGAALVRRLAADADIVVENFKVGGLTKFGLDAASLRAANPRLIYASITGFGQDGPYADRAGYDYIIQGMGGLMSITGLPDGEPGGGPMRVGVAVVDLFTGLYTTIAILSALYRREQDRGGRAHRHGAVRHPAGDACQPGEQCPGQRQRPAAAGRHPSQYRALPAVRRGRSADHHRHRQQQAVRKARRDLRPCRVDDRSALRRQWRASREPGGDGRADIARVIATRPAAEWLEQLEDAGIPAGPINRISQALGDVQAQHRQMVRTIAGVPMVGSPVRLDGERADSDLPPPALGEHTIEILKGLGIADSEALELQEAGITG